MPYNSRLHQQYRAYLKMYASMLSDLADTPGYVSKLISNDTHSEFERGLRCMIVNAINEK